jgi:three-Cys-motif partner protein
MDPVRWKIEDHTRAKHRVLRSYLDAWIPIMGYQSKKAYQPDGPPRLLLVDGFAGPGTYLDGEPGSPLIMLDALLSHASLEKLGDVIFLYLFIEQDPRRVAALKEEIAKLEVPANVKIHVEPGRFEDRFSELIAKIKGNGKSLVPTFAFIDPFGYSSASMSLTGSFLDFPRSEALFFLPLSFVHRFVGRAGQEATLNSLFDGDRWREAIPLSGDDRKSFLMELFEEVLSSQGQVKHVASFRLNTNDGNDYRLVFATQHEKGLDQMKRAMWKVDPISGISYSAKMNSGQEMLFSLDPDTGPLLAELKRAFGSRWFTVTEATEVTRPTPFVSDSHLKRLTLAPAEKVGVLEVKRKDGQRSGTFGDDVRMRFL